MSSSGTVSNVQSTPTTSLGEKARKTGVQSSAGDLRSPTSEKGVVRTIHSTGLKVKATTERGELIANGEWITLDYPVNEFVQTFGDIQEGDIIRIASTGLGGNPTGVIVGRTGENPEKAIRLENKVKLGVGPFLFPPGIGIG